MEVHSSTKIPMTKTMKKLMPSIKLLTIGKMKNAKIDVKRGAKVYNNYHKYKRNVSRTL